MDFAVQGNHRVKLKESKKRDEYLDIDRELKKTMEHVGESDTNCSWCAWNSHKMIAFGLDDLKTRERVETTQTTALLR